MGGDQQGLLSLGEEVGFNGESWKATGKKELENFFSITRSM